MKFQTIFKKFSFLKPAREVLFEYEILEKSEILGEQILVSSD